MRGTTAGLVFVFGLLAAGGALAQASRLVPPGEPEPDRGGPVEFDRYHEMPGYLVPDAAGARVCVPFLVSVSRPPAGHAGASPT